MPSFTELLSEALRAIAVVLARASPEALEFSALWDRAHSEVLGDEFDERWRSTAQGKSTVRELVRPNSVGMVKSGWLNKTDGRWRLTPAGRVALDTYKDPRAFNAAAGRGYKYWDTHRSGFEQVERLAEMAAGGWVSTSTVATLTGLESERVFAWLQAAQPDGWYRILDDDGRPPRTLQLTPAENYEWQRLLEDDGVSAATGHADPFRRKGVEELRELLADVVVETEPVEFRAWLVRGTGPRGESLAPDWLEHGYCSLAASNLRTLPPGTSREEIAHAVREDFEAEGYDQQSRLTTEVHDFLTRMREGDLVLTNDGEKLYIGTVTGPPAFTASEGRSANLQRPVVWDNPRDPIDFLSDRVPDELSVRVSTEHQMIDLTDLAGTLAALRAHEPVIERPLVLPDATPKLATDLLAAQPWVDECVDMLRDRPQMIFHGPPGTGKTHLALELARHLTGGRPENVKLVQFHPAYTYEDFFQGYRPVEEADGARFARRDGPLLRLVTAARAHEDQPYVLVIDEINRGNIAKIFGELYFLLEYRDQAVDLMYAKPDEKPFRLPANLLILATMNTADRSIALLDSAMRRRFWFRELHPRAEPTASMLAKWLEEHQKPTGAARLLRELNDRIDDPDFKVGPTYLMREALYDRPGGLARVWRNQILPLLAEHHYGDGTDIEARYGLATLCSALRIAPETIGGAG